MSAHVKGIGGGGVNLKETTATPEDIRHGKTAGTKSGIVEGNIPDCIVTNILPGTENQIISVGQYIAEDIIVLGDESLNEDNIIENAEIFGVKGNRRVYNYGMIYNIINEGTGIPTDVTIRMPKIPSNFMQTNDAGINKLPVFNYVTKFEIFSNLVESMAFREQFRFTKNRIKFKFHVTTLQDSAIYDIGSYYKTKTAIWLSKDCKTLTGYPFKNGNMVGHKFYCETESKPAGWSNEWYYDYPGYEPTGTVLWGVTEEQFDAL